MKDSYNVLKTRSEGTYSELRSKFLAFAIPIRSVKEAMEQVAKFQKDFYDARHVCWAYRIGPEGETYRSNDNGEPSGTAGKPILGQMVSAGVSDLIVLVVRYFGGVKLGTSGLIQAYRAATVSALESGEFTERLVEKPVRLTLGYEQMSLVMRIIKEVQANIISQDYLENGNVVMSLMVRLSMVDRLRSAFIVNGRSIVTVDAD